MGGYTHCVLTLSLSKKISALILEVAYEMVVISFETTAGKYMI